MDKLQKRALRRRRRRAIGVLLVFLIPLVLGIFLSLGRVHFHPLPTYHPQGVNAAGDSLYHQIPAFQAVSLGGDTLTTADLRGRIHVASFFHSGCGSPCVRLGKTLAELQQYLLDNDFQQSALEQEEVPELQLLTFTTQPKQDSLPLLRSFVQQFEPDSSFWRILRAEDETTDYLAQQGYKLQLEGSPQDTLSSYYSQYFVLVDTSLHIRGYYSGVKDITGKTEVERLKEDLKVLLYEYRELRQDSNPHSQPPS